MVRTAGDQAEGLRRLLAPAPLRVLTFAAGREGVGRTSALANVAAVLAKLGYRVLVIDENRGPENLNGLFNLGARYDLLHVLNQDKPLSQVVVPGPNGIRVLPAARGLAALAKAGDRGKGQLEACLRLLTPQPQVVLVDTAAGVKSGAFCLDFFSQEIVVVLSPSVSAITEGYALVKAMYARALRHRFQVLVTKAPDQRAAQAVYANVAEVAQRYSEANLGYLGYVPVDGSLRRAGLLGRPVSDCFPFAPAAASFRRLAEAVAVSPRGAEKGGLPEFMGRLARADAPVPVAVNA